MRDGAVRDGSDAIGMMEFARDNGYLDVCGAAALRALVLVSVLTRDARKGALHCLLADRQ